MLHEIIAGSPTDVSTEHGSLPFCIYYVLLDFSLT